MSEKISQKVHAILTIPNNIEQLQAYGEYVRGLNEADRFAAEAAMDALKIERDRVNARQVVVLLHGMNTAGVWQESVRSELAEFKNISVEVVGYGWYDVFRFLLPVPFSWLPISQFRDDLRDIRSRYPGVRMMVIAHSFGTYITSKVLKGNLDIRLDALLLCGSIVKIRFPWQKLPNRPEKANFVNDVGTRDAWPILAGVFSFAYGPSGAMGFKCPSVTDRYFNYAHSDFFNVEHVRNFWFPFILRREIVEGAMDRQRKAPGLLKSLFSTKLPHVSAALILIFWLLGARLSAIAHSLLH